MARFASGCRDRVGGIPNLRVPPSGCQATVAAAARSSDRLPEKLYFLNTVTQSWVTQSWAVDPPRMPKLPPDGRSARARRLREERRAQVLATARRLFAERGYHNTSISEIIAACRIARGTFYLYFESKRAIFDELLDDLFA